MYNPQKSYHQMKEHFENVVAPGVATERKKYVSPEIEVINLDSQPQLLAGSPFSPSGVGFDGIGEEDI